MHSPLFDELVKQLSQLPGVGNKSATRMAYFLLTNPNSDAHSLERSLSLALKGIHPCQRCFNLAEDTLCGICEDRRRDTQSICVVARPSDILVLERSGCFKGLYHVLGGTLSPLDGIGPDKLHLVELKNRVEAENINEIILALGGTSEAEATSLYIERQFKESSISLTRLARGIPMGADIEYLDERTLFNAMEMRTRF